MEPDSTPTVRAAAVASTSPLLQVMAMGRPVNHPPSVRVVDESGVPVEGVPVRFEGAPTSGSLQGTHRTTDAAGIATLGAWTLPQTSGIHSLSARVDGVAPVEFQAEAVAHGFDIELRSVDVPPGPVLATALERAEAKWESIIFGDLDDEAVVATPVCGGRAVIDEVVDDVLILVKLDSIDGVGGVGALGFPCLIRAQDATPVVSMMVFDTLDNRTAGVEWLTALALHEVTHALGFIRPILTITTTDGLVRDCLRNPSTPLPNPIILDTHFACASARAAFDRLGGAAYAGGEPVPFENGAPMGKASASVNHHWRETALGSELMTSDFVGGLPFPLSLLTIAAMEDLAYSVVYAEAEPFSFASAAPSASVSTSPPEAHPSLVFEHDVPDLVLVPHSSRLLRLEPIRR